MIVAMNGILSAYSCDCLMSINELVNVTLSILLNSICNCRHSLPCIALDFIILYALTITSLFSISAIAIFSPDKPHSSLAKSLNLWTFSKFYHLVIYLFNIHTDLQIMCLSMFQPSFSTSYF